VKAGLAVLVLGASCLAFGLLFSSPGNGQEAVTEPARADAEGWVDLLPGKDLKGWRRVPLAPDTKLNPKNPWSVDTSSKTLLCDGVGVKEMFLFEKEFKDGAFHVEWRFRKVEDKDDYNSGVYVRTALDGKFWHQSQVAHLQKPPRMADLFGETLKNGQPMKFLVEGQGAKLVRPPGEWNTYDITCRGTKVVVAVNGKDATTWDDCQVSRGHVGLQAEFFFIEFKNLRFKPLE
jgi:Domain of Unknown Function (DUF1080)